MNDIARSYVSLVLQLGVHDPSYVDAYYGPEEWRSDEKVPLEDLLASCEQLQSRLSALAPIDKATDRLLFMRAVSMEKQLVAVKTHISRLLTGVHLPFDDEAEQLYDARPPHKEEAEFAELLSKLDARLPPMEGATLAERYGRWKQYFVIPTEKVDAVFQCAIAEAKRQTERWITLPPGESFVVEYVTGKPWGGYNWYKGKYFSVIQVNTELPIYIDRAFDLAAHEGYPGHHVYNSLLEEKLFNQLGWVEFCVYPLFSPQSFIAEGTANFGIQMVFPDIEQRIAFEQDHVFPLAGLDPSRAREYYEIEATMRGLDYSGNEAARAFLDGTRSADETVAYLVSKMASPESAKRRLTFYSTYRSYVINYNLGQDLVREHVARRVHDTHGAAGAESAAEGSDGLLEARWRIFEELLTSPQIPSLL